jgi:DNA mismatch endonuclease (patch repair protein)
VRGKDTGPEMIVRRLVHGMGYRYRLHVRSLPGNPDLVLVWHRKIILVHGCFCHLHKCARCRVPASNRRYWVAKLERNAQRDARVRRSLCRAGWRVLVVWECQTVASGLKKLRGRIKAFLDKR